MLLIKDRVLHLQCADNVLTTCANVLKKCGEETQQSYRQKLQAQHVDHKAFCATHGVGCQSLQRVVDCSSLHHLHTCSNAMCSSQIQQLLCLCNRPNHTVQGRPLVAGPTTTFPEHSTTSTTHAPPSNRQSAGQDIKRAQHDCVGDTKQHQRAIDAQEWQQCCNIMLPRYCVDDGSEAPMEALYMI